jgi:spore coat protein A, manganese oxidase
MIFPPTRADRLAPESQSAQNSRVRFSWGMRSRALGRLTATTAALALGGAAVVLMGQGASGTDLQEASATSPAAVVTDPVQLTISNFTFSPKPVTVPEGGTLVVTNNDPFTHSVTSDAFDSSGVKRLFSIDVPADATVEVPNISTLGGGTYAFHCRFHTGMHGTLVKEGPSDGTIGGTPPSFDQPFVQPPRLTGRNIKIVMKKADVQVLPGAKTPMLTFGGTFPGPTIVRRTGQDTKVTYVNRLPRAYGAVTVHQHGGHQRSADDGQPDSFLIRHGRSRTYDFPLRDAGKPLPAALRFYHDHRMNLTARNNWYGLQGMFLTTDPHDAEMGLPHGRYDIPLAVTDRSFDPTTNALTNPWASPPAGSPPPETIGDRVLVNGRWQPHLNVQPGLYRFQILNSSLAATYEFALDNGDQFTQIGTGSGLLPHPVERTSISLGPAQRADVVIDFRHHPGEQILLNSIGATTAYVMQFRVGTTAAPAAKVPSTLASIQHFKVPNRIAMRWNFGLTTANGTSFWSINGKRYNPDRVDHKVVLGRTEKWLLHNNSPITHYVHLHEELWRTISRDGKPPPQWERGYEDTWRLDPGETVIVAARFTDFTGDFMVHCHMLDHEDDGMMATFRVVK